MQAKPTQKRVSPTTRSGLLPFGWASTRPLSVVPGRVSAAPLSWSGHLRRALEHRAAIYDRGDACAGQLEETPTFRSRLCRAEPRRAARCAAALCLSPRHRLGQCSRSLGHPRQHRRSGLREAQIARPQRVQARTWRPITTVGLPGLWPTRKQRRRRIARSYGIGPWSSSNRGKPA